MNEVATAGAVEIEGQTYRLCTLVRSDSLSDLPTVERGERISQERRAPAPPLFHANTLPGIYGHHIERAVEPCASSIVGLSEPIDLVRCVDAVLAGHDGVVLTAGDRALEWTTSFLMPHLSHSLFRRRDDVLYVRNEGSVPRRSGVYYLGYTPQHQNYAHWTADTLPIWWFYARRFKKDGIKLVVPNKLKPFHEQALSLLGIGPDDLFLMPNSQVAFETLICNTGISLWTLPDLVTEAARSIAESLPARPSGRRIYFSRGDVTQRLLVNEASVLKVLDEFGFERVLGSTLSWPDQIRLMREASIVVGVHGAAMANIIYCRPGAHVLELIPEYCMQPEFRAVAARCGAHYSYVCGTSFDLEDSRSGMTSWDCNFVLGEDELRYALMRIVAAAGEGWSADPAAAALPRSILSRLRRLAGAAR